MIINEKYIKQISIVFRDIYYKIRCKNFMGKAYTGKMLSKLIVNAVQSLNIKDKINITKIINRTVKELGISSYNFHTQLYK